MSDGKKEAFLKMYKPGSHVGNRVKGQEVRSRKWSLLITAWPSHSGDERKAIQNVEGLSHRESWMETQHTQ